MADENPRRADGVSYEILEGRAVVIDPDGREIITLNEVGTAVWEHLDGMRDVAALVDALQARFEGVSREQLERDVRDFLEELREAGIVAGAPAG